MTEDLSNKKCVPCEGGIPPFTIDQINTYQKKVDNWDVKEDIKDQYYLIKEFSFKKINKESDPDLKKLGLTSVLDLYILMTIANEKGIYHETKENDKEYIKKIDKLANKATSILAKKYNYTYAKAEQEALKLFKQ